MNDYIISPALIYWLGRCDSIKGIMLFLCIVVGVITLITSTIYFFEREDENYYADAKRYCNRYRKSIAVLIVTLFISMVGAIFIPTKDELIKMQLCKYATKTNAEQVLKVLDEKTDALIEAIGKRGK